MPASLCFDAGMKKRHTTQYTVRDISEAADSRVRETAAMEDISLNHAVLRALDRGLGLAEEPVRYRSLGKIVAGASGKVDRKGWADILGSMDEVNAENWT